MTPHTPQPTPAAVIDNPTARRGFLAEALAFITGGLIVLAPLAASVAFFFDPLYRKNRKRAGSAGGVPRRDAEGYLRVTPLASLPGDGKPRSFTVYDDLVDAWNKFPNQPIGRVFLRKVPGGSVTAFNVRCPHLGCSVDYRAEKNDYFCPCHTSTFNLDGRKENEIPPRGMDSLDVKIKSGEVWVKFQFFKAATPDRIAIPV